MSRRLTGWLLAALVAAGPTTALGSVGLNGDEDRDVKPAVPVLVDVGKGYIDCTEILTSRNPLILRDGKVVLLQPGMTSDDLMKVLQGARRIFDNPDDNLLLELVSSGRVRFGSPKKTWPSLPIGELLPEGKKPTNLVGAPCGMPPGMTRLVPAAEALRLGIAM